MRVAATRSEGVFVVIAYSSSCHARYRCCGAVFPLPLTELKINIDKLGDIVSLLVALHEHRLHHWVRTNRRKEAPKGLNVHD